MRLVLTDASVSKSPILPPAFMAKALAMTFVEFVLESESLISPEACKYTRPAPALMLPRVRSPPERIWRLPPPVLIDAMEVFEPDVRQTVPNPPVWIGPLLVSVPEASRVIFPVPLTIPAFAVMFPLSACSRISPLPLAVMPLVPPVPGLIVMSPAILWSFTGPLLVVERSSSDCNCVVRVELKFTRSVDTDTKSILTPSAS